MFKVLKFKVTYPSHATLGKTELRGLGALDLAAYSDKSDQTGWWTGSQLL